MAERSEKQDQDELQNDKERNLTPRTASIVDCNCITMCQGNRFDLLVYFKYVCSEFEGI